MSVTAKMVDGGAIPLTDASEIMKKRGMAYVIIFGVQVDGQKFHVTTYGRNRKLCKLASNIGDQISQSVLSGKVHPPEKEPLDANWFDDAHKPTEHGVYYYEKCDDFGNPLPGFLWLKDGEDKYPQGIWKAFGPIRGAMQQWPMTARHQEAGSES